jgi:hypothetical protein
MMDKKCQHTQAKTHTTVTVNRRNDALPGSKNWGINQNPRLQPCKQDITLHGLHLEHSNAPGITNFIVWTSFCVILLRKVQLKEKLGLVFKKTSSVGFEIQSEAKEEK